MVHSGLTVKITWGAFHSTQKFRKFRLVHQTERTISVLSDQNIRDQLWRWSTLTGLVVSVGRTECPFPFDVIVVPSKILFCTLLTRTIGSFSNDDGDDNQDVKKAIGLLRKTTTLHVHNAFLYISLPSLHDYDVKMPNCKFYGGRTQATTNLFFSL